MDDDLLGNRELAEAHPLPGKRVWHPHFRPLYLLWVLAPVLLWWTFRKVHFADIQVILTRLSVWQLASLLLVNAVIFLLFGTRWWLLIRSFGRKVNLSLVIVYRLMGFAVSYFTPGPQVGGEPLQVMLLVRRKKIPAAEAISSVLLDKLLELLANVAFLGAGLILTAASNVRIGLLKPWMGMAAVVVLALPVVYLIMLWRGRLPVTWLAEKLETRPQSSRMAATAEAAERQVSTLCHDHPQKLWLAISLSFLIWIALIGEYWLTLRFLGLQFNLAQTMVALTLSRIAFLVPLPGGLGALEASQVLAMNLLGYNPVFGVTVSLVIRARDILSGLLGLAMGSLFSR